MLQYALHTKGCRKKKEKKTKQQTTKPKHNKTSKDFPLDIRYLKRKTEGMKPKRMHYMSL